MLFRGLATIEEQDNQIEQKLEQARAYISVPMQEQATKQAAAKPQATVQAEGAANDKTQASSQPISPATGQAKPEERKFPPAIPTVNLDLKFKPMLDITQVNHYIKYVPAVFDTNLFFDWHESLYEINNSDKRFLATLNGSIEQGSLPGPQLEERDLERVLDILEKVYYIKKELTDVVLLANFE